MPKDPVLYEAMYIVPVDMSAEEIAVLEERLKAGLEGEGAQVESVHEFSQRRLAYPILGYTEGLYRIIYFRGEGAAVDELKHEMSLSEEIIRGTVVVANPKYMIGQQPAPEQAAQAEAEEPEVAEEAQVAEELEEPEEAEAAEEPEQAEAAEEPEQAGAAEEAEEEPAAGTTEEPGGDEAPATQQ